MTRIAAWSTALAVLLLPRPATAGLEAVSRAAAAAPAVRELDERSLAQDGAAAAATLREALALVPDSDYLHYNLACVLALEGRRDEAVVALLAAFDHGWSRAQEVRADEDLASILGDSRVLSRLSALESEALPPWPIPSSPLEADAARADAVAARWSEAIAGTFGVFSEGRAQREWRELRAWRAASWDRAASTSAAPWLEEWRAIEAILGDSPDAPAMFDRASLHEARRRISRWLAARSSAGRALEPGVLLADARVRHALGTTSRAEPASAHDARLGRDLAVLALLHPEAPATEDALVQLVGLLREDLRSAAAVQERLLASATDPRAMRRRLMADAAARSVYWRTTPLPALTAKDLDGAALDLAALGPGPTLLSFWATWCAPCHQELAILRELAPRLPPDLRIVRVSLDPPDLLDADGLRAWCREHDVPGRHVRDVDQSPRLAEALGVTSIPFNLLVVDGKVQATSLELDGPDGRLARLGEHVHLRSPDSVASGPTDPVRPAE